MGLWTDTRTNRLINAIKRDAIQYGDFKLASGKSSKYYIDARKVTLSSDAAPVIGRTILGKIPSNVVAVGGPILGADPIVGATLAVAGQNHVELYGFLVRPKPKDHGTQNLIEGTLPKGSSVVLVDDVVTTGQSIIEAANVVRAAGCTVAMAIVVVDRMQGAWTALSKVGIQFESLVTVKDLGITPD